jgi:hypothetical protein
MPRGSNGSTPFAPFFKPRFGVRVVRRRTRLSASPAPRPAVARDVRRFLVPRGRANKATVPDGRYSMHPDESISSFFLRLRIVCVFVATLFLKKKVRTLL